MTRLSVLLSFLVVACSTSEVTPILVPCRSSTSPSEITLRAGARVRIAREAVTNDTDATFEAIGPVRVFDDATSAGQLVVRSTYEDADAAIRVTCSDATTFDVPVVTAPVEFSNLATWSGDDGPTGREYFAMWQDRSQASRLWLYGGFVYYPQQFTPNAELWSFDLTTAVWTPYGVLDNAPLLPGARVAPASSANQYLFLGGTSDGDTPRSLRSLDVGTQIPTWTSASFSGAAPESYTGAWIRDERRNRWLSLCGASASIGINCAVKAYSETEGWSALPVDEATTAPPRFGFAYAYDELNDRVVVFAGQVGMENLDIGADTWALELGQEPARWVQLFESDEHATARRNAAFAYDSIQHRLFVWGGTPDGADSIPGMQVLHLDRGHEEWLSFATPTEMPSRTSGAGVYDATTNSIYWGFGNDDSVYTDLWRMQL